MLASLKGLREVELQETKVPQWESMRYGIRLILDDISRF